MRIDYFVSRFCHQMAFAILVGATVFKYLGVLTLTTAASKKVMLWSGIVVLFTGLYNAGAAKPSQMGAQAGRWRMVVYGLKIPLYLFLTPLPAKLGFPVDPFVDLCVVVTIVALASYSKFYREDVLAAAKPAAAKE